MSAWIVSKSHITLLVEACFKYEIVKPEDGTPDDVGKLLWRENHKSVNYRYSEGPRSRTPKYSHKSLTTCNRRIEYKETRRLGYARDLVRDSATLLKAIHCYNYQTCEHHTWKRSSAYRLMIDLENALVRSLPPKMSRLVQTRYGDTVPAIEESAAYDKAPWGID